MKKEVNLVEYCSDFATIATEAYADGANEAASDYDRDIDTFTWKEKYQKIFDNFYDEYWNLMLDYGFKHKND